MGAQGFMHLISTFIECDGHIVVLSILGCIIIRAAKAVKKAYFERKQNLSKVHELRHGLHHLHICIKFDKRQYTNGSKSSVSSPTLF
jgi:hypothetical protein